MADYTIPSIENKKIAREFLIKDYMLVSTASFSKCDVILTSDISTFIPIANQLNFPAVGLIRENFDVSSDGSAILGLK